MSSIQSVQGSSAAAQAIAQRLAPKAESFAQEAQETPAVTRAEASKGDRQAIRKLTQLQAAEKPQQEAPVAPTPAQVGGNVNVTA